VYLGVLRLSFSTHSRVLFSSVYFHYKIFIHEKCLEKKNVKFQENLSRPSVRGPAVEKHWCRDYIASDSRITHELEAVVTNSRYFTALLWLKHIWACISIRQLHTLLRRHQKITGLYGGQNHHIGDLVGHGWTPKLIQRDAQLPHLWTMLSVSRSACRLNYVTILETAWRVWRKLWKTLGRISGAPAEIRTEHLSLRLHQPVRHGSLDSSDQTVTNSKTVAENCMARMW
jgi:hypothetical protein